MSHLRERKEDNCLNCGAKVHGRFCHICGQENIEPKESVWHLISHFFNDITHFDGKFFSSLKYLLARPGFLSREYLNGRRASYLNPVRMYVFTSFVFFLVFFSLFKVDDRKMSSVYDDLKKKAQQADVDMSYAIMSGDIKVDGVLIGNMKEPDKINQVLFDSLIKAKAKIKPAAADTIKKPSVNHLSLQFSDKEYSTKEEYDSVQRSLPERKRDGIFTRAFIYKNFELKERYGSDQGMVLSKLSEKFIHSIPTLLFISLPFFALFLKLLYWRKKEMYYVNHAIFSIHYYIYCFIALLVYFGTDKLKSALHWGWLSWVKGLLVLSMFYYFYRALRNFYGQSRGKTVLKFIFLLLLLFVLMIVLFILTFLFTALNL